MNAGKFTAGLILLAVGILGFFETLHIYDTRHLWHYWPLILIAIGVSNEVEALRVRKSDGSFIMIGIGVWMLAGTQHWLGLSVARAMPLGIVVIGLAILLHAIIDRPAPATRKQENVHDQQ